MSAIRSHSQGSSGAGSTSVSASLTGVHAGDRLIAVFSSFFDGGSASSANVTDDQGNSWSPDLHGTAAFFLNNGHGASIEVWSTVAGATGDVNVTATCTLPGAFGLVLYDLAGTGNIISGEATIASGSVIGALGLTDTGSGQGVWIAAIAGPNGQNATTDSPFYFIDEAVSSSQCAVASLVAASGSTEVLLFNSPSPSSQYGIVVVLVDVLPPVQLQYLGRVRVVGSAPAGRSNPFLGTVKVVGSAPAGASDPYLGQVVEVGSAPAGNSNPALGEVVVIVGAPAGASDPYLGSVATS